MARLMLLLPPELVQRVVDTTRDRKARFPLSLVRPSAVRGPIEARFIAEKLEEGNARQKYSRDDYTLITSRIELR